MHTDMVNSVGNWKGGIFNIQQLWFFAFIYGYTVTFIEDDSFSILDIDNICITFSNNGFVLHHM